MLFDKNNFESTPLLVSDYFQKFSLPKGGIKIEDKRQTRMETCLVAALRELREETGIQSKYRIIDSRLQFKFEAGNSKLYGELEEIVNFRKIIYFKIRLNGDLEELKKEGHKLIGDTSNEITSIIGGDLKNFI